MIPGYTHVLWSNQNLLTINFGKYVSMFFGQHQPSSSTTMAALRQSSVVSRSSPLLVRLYSSSVPAKPPPPGTFGKPIPESSVDKIHLPLGKGYKSQGTSVSRTIRNIWKAGFKRAFWQIKEINDTKVLPLFIFYFLLTM